MNTRKYITIFSLFTCLFTSCSDFLEQDSNQVVFADKAHLTNAADTLWSMAGILGKMQVIADRTVLLGEVRGDLADVTNAASADLRRLAMFDNSQPNQYDSPRDYYAVINNCNYLIAHADTALRNNRNELIFMKEYAAAKAFRAWTYLQLVLNYGSVPLVTEPVLSKDEAERDYPYYDIAGICRYFIDDLSAYTDIDVPDYSYIRNTNSRLFYFPIRLLLGDLNLWAGNYRTAAEHYYQYIRSRNGSNSIYPLTTAAVRFQGSDARWNNIGDSWTWACFMDESGRGDAELITMIPGDSIPSEGNYSYLRNLFNANADNDWQAAVVPSDGMIYLSENQQYCHYVRGAGFIVAPSGLSDHKSGDLRLQAVYKSTDGVMAGGQRKDGVTTISKHATRNVHVYRRAMVYLRLAEALNCAGYPRFAFQMLKQGVNNEVIEREVVPYYPADSVWLRSFDFPENRYVIQTAAGQAQENTMGLHSRGSGYTSYNDSYVLPDDTLLTDSLARMAYQIEKVEDLIVDEQALELAFEGHRFYDLMRVALRRGDPSYLARRIYLRRGLERETEMKSLIKQDLTDTSSWYFHFTK